MDVQCNMICHRIKSYSTLLLWGEPDKFILFFMLCAICSPLVTPKCSLVADRNTATLK